MAVAIDNTSSNFNASGTTATSVTWAHTVKTPGADLYVQCYPVSATATTSGVTFNGVAMTQSGTTKNNGFIGLQVFYLTNVPAGTFNIVATFSAAVFYGVSATSFSGTTKTAPEVVTQGSGTTITPTNSLSTLTANDMLLDAVIFATSSTSGSSSVTASNGQTMIKIANLNGASSYGGVTGYRAATTVTSYTDAYTISASMAWNHNMYAIKAAPIPTNQFFAMF